MANLMTWNLHRDVLGVLKVRRKHYCWAQNFKSSTMVGCEASADLSFLEGAKKWREGMGGGGTSIVKEELNWCFEGLSGGSEQEEESEEHPVMVAEESCSELEQLP